MVVDNICPHFDVPFLVLVATGNLLILYPFLSKARIFLRNLSRLRNAFPAGQKNLHQNVDVKKDPMIASGRMYH